MGTLYVIGTPIGNMRDVTFRALDTLKRADVVFAEDTRVTRKLFSHYHIHSVLKRSDEASSARAALEICALMKRNKIVALVSDAGTPNIADPGARIITHVKAAFPDARIIAVPGPSSLTAALSVAGISGERFTFLGYPPHKKGRRTFFSNLSSIVVRPIVLFESPHRIAKTFTDIAHVFGTSHIVTVVRELTKFHEEAQTLSVSEAESRFVGVRGRGEFVVIIH